MIPNSFSLSKGALLQWRDAISDSISDSVTQDVISAYTGNRLTSALDSLQFCLDDLEQAAADVAALLTEAWSNVGMKPAECYQVAQQRAQSALDAATAACKSLDTAANSVQSQIEDKLLPGSAKGLSDVLLVEQKADYRRLFDAVPAEGLLEAYRAELDRALDTSDDVCCFVLTHSLDLYLRSRGLSDALLAQTIAQSVGRAAAGGDGQAIPGGQLRAALVGGGPGTFRGYLTTCDHLIYNQAQALLGHIADRQAEQFGIPSPQTSAAGALEDWIQGKYTAPASQSPTMRPETSGREYQGYYAGKGPLQF